MKKKKEQFGKIAVFPCKLKMLPDHIYTRRDPIVAGVKVEVSDRLTIMRDRLSENLEEEMESQESILIFECPGWYYQVWHPALCPEQGVHLLGNLHITSGEYACS